MGRNGRYELECLCWEYLKVSAELQGCWWLCSELFSKVIYIYQKEKLSGDAAKATALSVFFF